MMDEKMFKERTKRLGIAVIRLIENLPRTITADVIGRQLVRSSTSIGANYRAVCRAKSTADMINKFKNVEEEADETAYWLEILTESKILDQTQVAPIAKETDEILAMTVASLRTLRTRKS
jgi:four helix bundle protein